MQRNNSNSTPPAGNTPIPFAIVRQWEEADTEETSRGWAFVSGLIAGLILSRPHDPDLLFLFVIADRRSQMAGREVAA